MLLKYIRLKKYAIPVIVYGLENITMTKGEEEKIHRCVGKVMKRSLNLNDRLHATKLYYSIKMNTIKRQKLGFILNIYNNPKLK